jgi:hypothetical protein
MGKGHIRLSPLRRLRDTSSNTVFTPGLMEEKEAQRGKEVA